MVRLVRPVNLLIIGITMIIFWFYLISPILLGNDITPLLNNSRFTLLMLMTMLIAAGGYVINDMLDTQTDLVNKPEKIYIGTKLSYKDARLFYLLLNFAAILLAFFISYSTESYVAMSVCVACIAILWLYSKYLKSTILIGNVVVSLLIGGVPFIFIIIESSALAGLYDLRSDIYLSAYSVLIAFTVFAFLANMIREVVKDCEDIEGDQKANILTLATGLGLKKADIVSQTLTIILMITAIAWIFLKGIYVNVLELTAHIFLIVLPIIYLFWELTKEARTKKKYIILNRHLKLMMVFGLIYLLVHLNMNYA